MIARGAEEKPQGESISQACAKHFRRVLSSQFVPRLRACSPARSLNRVLVMIVVSYENDFACARTSSARLMVELVVRRQMLLAANDLDRFNFES